MSKNTVKTAVAQISWRGFTLQKGSLFGKGFIEGKYVDFAYMGAKRRITRPDGTKGGWQIKIFVKPHQLGDDEQVIFKPIWVDCTKGSLAKKLLEKNPEITWEHQPHISWGLESPPQGFHTPTRVAFG